jgi:hypothetical protein
MTRSLLALFLVSAICCRLAADDPAMPTEPYTYESLRAWHAKLGRMDPRWPNEWRLDLNQDGSEEVFLGFMGFGRGMEYALFTHRPTGWVRIADIVDGSDHPFELLPEQHGGWHDFLVVLPSGRDGLEKDVYSWDGKSYVLKSGREVKALEIAHQ